MKTSYLRFPFQLNSHELLQSDNLIDFVKDGKLILRPPSFAEDDSTVYMDVKISEHSFHILTGNGSTVSMRGEYQSVDIAGEFNFYAHLNTYLGLKESNDLQDHWNHQVTTSLLKCLAPTHAVNGAVLISKLEERQVYFYVKDDCLHCDIIAGVALTSPPTGTSADKSYSMPGKIRATCKIGGNGFELVSVDSTNSSLFDLTSGKRFSIDMLERAREQEYSNAVEELESTVQAQKGSDDSMRCILAREGEKVLNSVRKAKPLASKQEVEELIEILQKTNYAIHRPMESFDGYKQLTEKTIRQGKRHVGKMIGGAMLCFAGTLGIVAGFGLTLTGFGAPIGIPLKIASLMAIKAGFATIMGGVLATGLGSIIAHDGREKGVKRHAGLFFKKLRKQQSTAVRENTAEIKEDVVNDSLLASP